MFLCFLGDDWRLGLFENGKWVFVRIGKRGCRIGVICFSIWLWLILHKCDLGDLYLGVMLWNCP